MDSPTSQVGGGGENEFTTSPSKLPAAVPSPVPGLGSGTSVWPAVTVKDVPPKPLIRHHLSDERLEMLSTLPRSRWDEKTSAALGGAIAALPSAIDAVHSALQRNPFALQAFECIQVIILVVFSVWLVVQYFHLKGEKTSGEFLAELRAEQSGGPTNAN